MNRYIRRTRYAGSAIFWVLLSAAAITLYALLLPLAFGR